MIPVCAWKDVIKFNLYMAKSDFKNLGPLVVKEKKSKNKEKQEAQDVNIQVDIHVNKPEENNDRTQPKAEEKTVIDVEPEEIRPADTAKEDAKEKMLKFESEPVVNGPDFSNADKVTINDPIPGVNYEEPKDTTNDFREVTPEDLDEAIKAAKSKDQGKKKK